MDTDINLKKYGLLVLVTTAVLCVAILVSLVIRSKNEEVALREQFPMAIQASTLANLHLGNQIEFEEIHKVRRFAEHGDDAYLFMATVRGSKAKASLHGEAKKVKGSWQITTCTIINYSGAKQPFDRFDVLRDVSFDRKGP